MSIMRITKSGISTDMNELRVDMFHAIWEITTHEGHAGDSRRHNVGGGGALTLGGRRRRSVGGTDVYSDVAHILRLDLH